MAELLNDTEVALWNGWKHATASVMDAVVTDIANATGLSSADFSVLTRVVEDGGGRIRQQRLSDDLEWKRSRLSRHLARMEVRGLVERGGSVAERLITATKLGRDLTRHARLVHADSVRQNLLGSIPTESAEQFWTTIMHMPRPASS